MKLNFMSGKKKMVKDVKSFRTQGQTQTPTQGVKSYRRQTPENNSSQASTKTKQVKRIQTQTQSNKFKASYAKKQAEKLYKKVLETKPKIEGTYEDYTNKINVWIDKNKDALSNSYVADKFPKTIKNIQSAAERLKFKDIKQLKKDTTILKGNIVDVADKVSGSVEKYGAALASSAKETKTFKDISRKFDRYKASRFSEAVKAKPDILPGQSGYQEKIIEWSDKYKVVGLPEYSGRVDTESATARINKLSIDPNYTIQRDSSGNITKISSKSKTYTSTYRKKDGKKTYKDKSTYIPYEMIIKDGKIQKEITRDDYDYDRRKDDDSYKENSKVYDKVIKTYKDGKIVSLKEYDSYKEKYKKYDDGYKKQYDTYLKSDIDYTALSKIKWSKPGTSKSISSGPKLSHSEALAASNARAISRGKGDFSLDYSDGKWTSKDGSVGSQSMIESLTPKKYSVSQGLDISKFKKDATAGDIYKSLKSEGADILDVTQLKSDIKNIKSKSDGYSGIDFMPSSLMLSGIQEDIDQNKITKKIERKSDVQDILKRIDDSRDLTPSSLNKKNREIKPTTMFGVTKSSDLIILEGKENDSLVQEIMDSNALKEKASRLKESKGILNDIDNAGKESMFGNAFQKTDPSEPLSASLFKKKVESKGREEFYDIMGNPISRFNEAKASILEAKEKGLKIDKTLLIQNTLRLPGTLPYKSYTEDESLTTASGLTFKNEADAKLSISEAWNPLQQATSLQRNLIVLAKGNLNKLIKPKVKTTESSTVKRAMQESLQEQKASELKSQLREFTVSENMGTRLGDTGIAAIKGDAKLCFDKDLFVGYKPQGRSLESKRKDYFSELSKTTLQIDKSSDRIKLLEEKLPTKIEIYTDKQGNVKSKSVLDIKTAEDKRLYEIYKKEFKTYNQKRSQKENIKNDYLISQDKLSWSDKAVDLASAPKSLFTVAATGASAGAAPLIAGGLSNIAGLEAVSLLGNVGVKTLQFGTRAVSYVPTAIPAILGTSQLMESKVITPSQANVASIVAAPFSIGISSGIGAASDEYKSRYTRENGGTTTKEILKSVGGSFLAGAAFGAGFKIIGGVGSKIASKSSVAFRSTVPKVIAKPIVNWWSNSIIPRTLKEGGENALQSYFQRGQMREIIDVSKAVASGDKRQAFKSSASFFAGELGEEVGEVAATGGFAAGRLTKGLVEGDYYGSFEIDPAPREQWIPRDEALGLGEAPLRANPMAIKEVEKKDFIGKAVEDVVLPERNIIEKHYKEKLQERDNLVLTGSRSLIPQAVRPWELEEGKDFDFAIVNIDKRTGKKISKEELKANLLDYSEQDAKEIFVKLGGDVKDIKSDYVSMIQTNGQKIELKSYGKNVKLKKWETPTGLKVNTLIAKVDNKWTELGDYKVNNEKELSYHKTGEDILMTTPNFEIKKKIYTSLESTKTTRRAREKDLPKFEKVLETFDYDPFKIEPLIKEKRFIHRGGFPEPAKGELWPSIGTPTSFEKSYGEVAGTEKLYYGPDIGIASFQKGGDVLILKNKPIITKEELPEIFKEPGTPKSIKDYKISKLSTLESPTKQQQQELETLKKKKFTKEEAVVEQLKLYEDFSKTKPGYMLPSSHTIGGVSFTGRTVKLVESEYTTVGDITGIQKDSGVTFDRSTGKPRVLNVYTDSPRWTPEQKKAIGFKAKRFKTNMDLFVRDIKSKKMNLGKGGLKGDTKKLSILSDIKSDLNLKQSSNDFASILNPTRTNLQSKKSKRDTARNILGDYSSKPKRRILKTKRSDNRILDIIKRDSSRRDTEGYRGFNLEYELSSRRTDSKRTTRPRGYNDYSIGRRDPRRPDPRDPRDPRRPDPRELRITELRRIDPRRPETRRPEYRREEYRQTELRRETETEPGAWFHTQKKGKKKKSKPNGKIGYSVRIFKTLDLTGKTSKRQFKGLNFL